MIGFQTGVVTTLLKSNSVSVPIAEVGAQQFGVATQSPVTSAP